MKFIKSIVFQVLLFLPAFLLMSAESGPVIHELDEVLKYSMDSEITYELDLQKGDFVAPPKLALVSPLLQKIKGGKYSISTHELRGRALESFNAGEEAYAAKDYKQALSMYLKTASEDPDFDVIHNFTGDAYYVMGDYGNAKKYFEKEVSINYTNYQAHWFLADTLWALGEKEEAAYEATVAHILNRNHAELKKRMIYYRENTGKPWKEWSYLPQCKLTKTGDKKVKISITGDWLGYGLDKALWRYEPGYAETHNAAGLGKGVMYGIEEDEALIAKVGKSKENSVLKDIADSDDRAQFVLYEVLALNQPGELASSSEETIKSIVKYIDKYH